MGKAEFAVDQMTCWEMLHALLERLQSLRMDALGFESPKSLEKRVRVCEQLAFELLQRERIERLFR